VPARAPPAGGAAAASALPGTASKGPKKLVLGKKPARG